MRWFGAAAVLAAAVTFAGPAWAARLPAVAAAVPSAERAPRDGAFVVGVEGYASLPQAVWAGADARAWRDWLVQTAGVGARSVVSLQNPDSRALLKEAKRIPKLVKPGGTLWIVYAGHGAITDDGGRLLLGADATAADPRGLPLRDAVDLALRAKGVARVVVVLDAPFGELGRDGLPTGLRPAAAPAPLPQDPRLFVWAPDAGLGPAPTLPPARHGAFTWAALGALRGWADGERGTPPDGRVTLGEATAAVQRLAASTGLPLRPTTAGGDRADWTLIAGKHLEAGPAPALLAEAAAEERARRVADAEAALRASAAAAFAELQSRFDGSPGSRDEAARFLDRFAAPTLTVSWSLWLPEAAAARALLDGAPAALGAPAAAAAPAAACDDLVALEPAAMMGQLDEGQRACLDARLRAERQQTAKDRISRILIVDAEAAQDPARWSALVDRHLQDIDRSDPDLCLRYAVHLHRQGVEGAGDVLRWADVALENKQVWVGAEHTKKVGSLLRLRAEAAHGLWTDAEARYKAEPTGDNENASEDARGLAKTTAREWLDYARAAKQPIDVPYNLCVSAAGTRAFCAE